MQRIRFEIYLDVKSIQLADGLDAEIEMEKGKINAQLPAPVTGYMAVSVTETETGQTEKGPR